MAKWDRLAIKNGSLRMIGDALALEPCREPLIYIKDDSHSDSVHISKNELRAYQVMGDRPDALAWAPFYMYLHNRMTITASATSSFAAEKPTSVSYRDIDGKSVAEQVTVGGEPLVTTGVFVLATFKIHFEEAYVHEPTWTEGSQDYVKEKWGVIASLPTDSHRSYDRYFQLISTCSIDTTTGEVKIYREKKVVNLYDETGYPFEGKLVLEGVGFDVKMRDVDYPE
jgi:hypothetical protein